MTGQSYKFKRQYFSNYDVASIYGISVELINRIVEEYNIPHVKSYRNILYFTSYHKDRILDIAKRVITND